MSPEILNKPNKPECLKAKHNASIFQSIVKAGGYIISFTHTEKVRQRRIEVEEIEEAIFEGMIIEPYPDDPRGPGCLISGFTKENRPLHILCGKLDEDEILIVTAYEPDREEWEADWRTRKRGI